MPLEDGADARIASAGLPAGNIVERRNPVSKQSVSIDLTDLALLARRRDLRNRGLINGDRWRPGRARILVQIASGGGEDPAEHLR